MTQLSRENPRFQPSNITWAHFPPLENTKLRKLERYKAMSDRALADASAWAGRVAASDRGDV